MSVPIGVPPKWFRQEQRLVELCHAAIRYHQEAVKIPSEWLREICDLSAELLARDRQTALLAPDITETQGGLRPGESRNLPYPRPVNDDDARKVSHCYIGGYCHYLINRRCMCTCAMCADAKARDC